MAQMADSVAFEMNNTVKLSTGKFSLFIIEDNKDIQELYMNVFEATGWQIIGQAYNGYEAIEMYFALEKKPDVVLCDIDLPGCSGLTVIMKIISRHPKQNIVVVSGCTDVLKHLNEFICLPTISKPFSFNILIDKICTFLISLL